MQQRLAGGLAAAAGLHADLAVLHAHLFGVTLTLVAAGLAGHHAGVHLGPEDPQVRLRLAHQDPPSGPADVGTIEVQADTVDKMGQMLLLSEAGVSA